MEDRNLLILYKPEQKQFDSYPKFSFNERRNLFRTTKRLDRSLKKLNSEARPYFFVMYAYFKTHNKFYDSYSPKDLKRAATVLAIKAPKEPARDETSKKYESMILKIFEFTRLSSRNEDYFIFFIHSMIRKRKDNKDIFDFLVEEFAKKKVAVPSYKEIETLIHKAFTLFNPYEQISQFRFTKLQKEIINEILDSKIDITNIKDKGKMTYKGSKLKKIGQSQKLKDIKESVKLYRDLKRYYYSFELFINLLELDDEGIKKTASEFKKMDLAKVRRLSVEKRNVLILSFIKDQYFKYTDHLVEVIIETIQKLQRRARAQYKDQVTKNQSDKNKTFLELIEVASNDNQLLMEVIQICQSKNKNSDSKIGNILDLLKGRIKGRTKRVEHYDSIKERLIDEDNLYSNLLLESFTSTKNKIAPILHEMEFEGENGKGKSILRSINYFKKHDCIDADEDSFLKESDKSHLALCEQQEEMYLTYLYQEVANAIKSGEVNLKHSYRYKSLEDYLIPKEEWTQNKKEILEHANLTKFSNIEHHLEDLEKQLNEKFKETNQNIKDGGNTYFNDKGEGKFTITTPATDFSTENLLYPYFPRTNFISLAEVMATVHLRTGFLNNFIHLKRTHLKGRPDDEVFIAGLMALGCNIGERKMGKISKSVNTNTLKNTVTWYFSKENLSNASDSIVNYMNELSLPKILQNHESTLHTSSDGAKWTVSRENILSKHSLKYFGINKGININSHIDERHLAFFSKVISTSDREAASVLDGLLHNSNVKSDIHSTDTHGYTEALFAIMSLLGFKFAPRIKSLKDQRVYSFKSPSEHKKDKDKIVPYRKINTSIIFKHYDEILRVAATIGTKYTEASQIFKRFNSYSNKNPLYKAIKELGKVHKSLFILEYLNDMNLRQRIEKQLNKVEESQRFSRAICFGNNQELIGEDFEEIEIGELSRRLIKNAIICWNYLYLTKKIIREKDKKSRGKIMVNISKSSILHWQHLNFLGEYDFSSRKINDSIGLVGPQIMKSNILKMWNESQATVQ